MAENKIFQALADPSRRAIFESLTSGEAAVKDLTARLRHLAASYLAAPCHFERRWLGHQPARGTLCLLSGGTAWDKAAHRLDRALPCLLDGARQSP